MKQIFRGPTAGKSIATSGFDVIAVALCINSGQVMDEVSVRCPIRTTDQKFKFRKVVVNIGENIWKVLIAVLHDLCGLILGRHGHEGVLPGLDKFLQAIRRRLNQRLKYTDFVLKPDIDGIGAGSSLLGNHTERCTFKSLLQELLLGTFQYFFIDTGYLRFSIETPDPIQRQQNIITSFHNGVIIISHSFHLVNCKIEEKEN